MLRVGVWWEFVPGRHTKDGERARANSTVDSLDRGITRLKASDVERMVRGGSDSVAEKRRGGLIDALVAEGVCFIMDYV